MSGVSMAGRAVFADVLFEAMQVLVLGQLAVSAPNPLHSVRADVDAL